LIYKMVTFICERCDQTLKKNQVDKHCQNCRDAWNFICIDCKKTFAGYDYDQHTSCLSEAEMTMGKYYKPKIKKVKTENNGNNEVEQNGNGLKTATNGTHKPQSEEKPKAVEDKALVSSNDSNDEPKEQETSWLGWKKTIKHLLKKKGEDGMLVKNLKKKLVKLLEASGYEVGVKEFDKYFEQYTKSRYFDITNNNRIKYMSSADKK